MRSHLIAPVVSAGTASALLLALGAAMSPSRPGAGTPATLAVAGSQAGAPAGTWGRRKRSRVLRRLTLVMPPRAGRYRAGRRATAARAGPIAPVPVIIRRSSPTIRCTATGAERTRCRAPRRSTPAGMPVSARCRARRRVAAARRGSTSTAPGVLRFLSSTRCTAGGAGRMKSLAPPPSTRAATLWCSHCHAHQQTTARRRVLRSGPRQPADICR